MLWLIGIGCAVIGAVFGFVVCALLTVAEIQDIYDEENEKRRRR